MAIGRGSKQRRVAVLKGGRADVERQQLDAGKKERGWMSYPVHTVHVGPRSNRLLALLVFLAQLGSGEVIGVPGGMSRAICGENSI